MPRQLETRQTADAGSEREYRPVASTDRTPVVLEAEEAEQDAATKKSLSSRLFQVVRGLLLLALLLAMAAWAAQWVRTSVLYVHETDARVKADLVAVSSTTDGILAERLVNEGDRVVRGQVLARIDSRAAVLALAEMKSKLEAIQAELNRVDAEAELTRGQVDSRIASARSRIGEAEAHRGAHSDELAFLETDFRRMAALAESGAIPGARLERARADLLKARRELQKAEAGVEKTKALLDEAIADRAELAVYRAERAALEAEALEIETRVERQQIDLADRTITSPIDGVVSGTFALAGAYVSTGKRLMVLHDPNGIWVETNIRETEVRRLEVGQPVRIEVDAYPDLHVEGRISRIGDAATSLFSLLPRLNDSSTFTKVTQRIKVRIDVAQPDDKLKPGMMVEVYVDDGAADGFWSWLQ